MAHIAERMSTHYLAVMGGYEVTDCPDPGQIAAYAREVRPQIMFGVPRVWEKIYAGVQAALGADPEKKAKFDEAVAAAIPISERRTLGTATAEDDATYAVPRRGRLRRRARARRPRRGRVRHHRRRADPGRAASAGTAPSACRCRRSTACPRAPGR